MRNTPSPKDTAPVQSLSSPSRQRGWLGAAEFARQQALLRIGRAALLPQTATPERRRAPRPLHRALPTVP
jgi:hypothetical protein